MLGVAAGHRLRDFSKAEPISTDELLGTQCRVEVAQIVLAQQGQRPGRLDPGSGEGAGIQVRPLDDAHPGQPCDARPLVLLPGSQQDRHLFAVGGGQFFDDPGGEGVVTAHDKMVAARCEPGEGRHGAILARMCDTGHIG